MIEKVMSGSMRGGWRGGVALDQSPSLPSWRSHRLQRASRPTLYAVSADARSGQASLGPNQDLGEGSSKPEDLMALISIAAGAAVTPSRAVSEPSATVESGQPLGQPASVTAVAMLAFTRIYSQALALTAEERVEGWRRQSCAVTPAPVRIC